MSGRATMNCPAYTVNGDDIEDPSLLEDALFPDEKEKVLALEVGESVTVGGGELPRWTIRRVQ